MSYDELQYCIHTLGKRLIFRYMNNNLKTSIIIPVYNGAKYLERCLQSITIQTLEGIEIIIVNDGSTDETEAICKSFALFDERVVIINQNNKGLSSARNTGLDIAKGDYIGFVDADDWIDLNFFEKLYDTAIKYDADIAVADFIREYHFKKKYRLNLKKEKVYFNTPDKYKICRMNKEGCVWNKIYRRELINDNNLRFEEGVLYEDREFTAKVLHYSNQLVAVPDTYYHYFVNNNSITRKHKSRLQKQNYIKAKQKVLKFVKENNIQVPNWIYVAEKFRFELFKIPLFTIKESVKTQRYCLLGVVPVFIKKFQNKLDFREQ